MFGLNLSLVLGAVGLGLLHGVEPGHGWPIAATYALEQSNKWFYGFASSFILGVGHLISSIAMVAVFFWAKSYFDLTQINDPVVLGSIADNTVVLGGPVSIVAGVILVALGVREYYGGGHSHDHGADGHGHGDGGHSHDHGDDGHAHGHGEHDHSHDHDGHGHDEGHSHHDHGHQHDHDSHTHQHDGHDDHGHHDDGGIVARLKTVVPFGGGHDHPDGEEAAERGLWGIAGFAFLLGFAHEEEFEIIGICLGTEHCLSLMLIYAVTVIVGIVALTLLLIAGYERFEDRVAGMAEHFPTISAAILVVMGVGFALGRF